MRPVQRRAKLNWFDWLKLIVLVIVFLPCPQLYADGQDGATVFRK